MIKIFITGGTFDKSYDHINGELYFEKTHLPKMIKTSKCKLDIKTETLLLKDSLDISKTDLFKVINACEKEISDKIIITHGTDTMTETAKKIGEKNLQKTIVCF